MAGTYGLWSIQGPFRGRIEKIDRIESEEPKESDSYTDKKESVYRVVVEIEVPPETASGIYQLRLLSPRGGTNPLPFRVTSGITTQAVTDDHSSADKSRTLALPALVYGRIIAPGAVDYYTFEISKPQTLAFEVWRHDTNFSPRLSLYSPSGSWLNPDRPQRLELSRTASMEPQSERWSYGFQESGAYLLRVGSKHGQASENFVYELSIGSSNETAPLLARKYQSHQPWSERSFERALSADHLDQLQTRTLPPEPRPDATAEPSGDGLPDSHETTGSHTAPDRESVDLVAEQEPNDNQVQAYAVSIPALIEGSIERPGDFDFFRFEAERNQKVAVEIQTLQSRVPQFNPALEILDAEGREILNNRHKKIALGIQDPLLYLDILKLHLPDNPGCGLTAITYLDQLAPKITLNFDKAGTHYLRVHDVSSQAGDSSFSYRLFLRPRMPHLGAVSVEPDHINLIAGQAAKLTVTTAHEEGFKGEVALEIGNLPVGVRAVTGTEVQPPGPIDDPSEREESMLPRTRKVTLLLLSDQETPRTRTPHLLQVTARPVLQGRVGESIPVGVIPLMVVSVAAAASAP